MSIFTHGGKESFIPLVLLSCRKKETDGVNSSASGLREKPSDLFSDKMEILSTLDIFGV